MILVELQTFKRYILGENLTLQLWHLDIFYQMLDKILKGQNKQALLKIDILTGDILYLNDLPMPTTS